MATKFITVSIKIMHDKKLSQSQKFILAEVDQLSQLDNGCFATNRHFSELIGISKQAVSNAISALEKNKYISIDNSNTKRNNGRIITIHSDVPPIHSDVQSKDNKTINKTINTIVDFLNTLTGKRHRATDKTKTLIKSRLKEGFTLDDFKHVIEVKNQQWKDDEKMSVFIRPDTLFGTKFDGYLNQESKEKEDWTRYAR